MAGEKWLPSLLKRRNDLTILTPEVKQHRLGELRILTKIRRTCGSVLRELEDYSRMQQF